MTVKKRVAKLSSLASYLPEGRLTNADLEKMVETTDEWIVSRTGIRERRIAKEESTSDLGAKSALKTLKLADLSPLDVDLILVATMTPDYLCPSTAALIQEKIGATRAAALDIEAACSGYIYLLATAKAFVESGIYRKVLVIAAEKMSSFLNYSDRSTCILFGDGATSALVSDERAGFEIGTPILGADGSGEALLKIEAGGAKCPATAETVAKGSHFVFMEGREVYKRAVRKMSDISLECLEKENLTLSDLSYFIGHQANDRILDAIQKQLNLPEEKMVRTIERYGNTSAASIGLALVDLLKTRDIKSGEKILLTAFGAGLTWGALLLREVS